MIEMTKNTVYCSFEHSEKVASDLLNKYSVSVTVIHHICDLLRWKV